MRKMQLIVLFIILHYVYCDLQHTSVKSDPVIITYVQDYYKCDLIILFGGNLNKKDEDWNQKVVIAQNNIKVKNMEEFKKAKKPLIVFFTNSTTTQFQLITTILHASKSVFIFFVNGRIRLSDFFRNVHLPHDFKFVISQKNETNQNQKMIWQIKLNNKNKVEKSLLGTWSQATGVEPFSKSKRRSTRLLRAGIFHNPPLSRVSEFEGRLKLKGYARQIEKTLENYTNLKLTYMSIHEIGIKENGKWSGGMGLLTNNSIDIFMTPFVQTPERGRDIDFTFPLVKSNLAMYLRQPNNEFSWNNYFEPFDITVWGVIILIMIVESIILTFFEYYQKIDVIRRLRKRSIKLPTKYGESILKVYGAMCSQSLSSSHFNPIRILQLIIHVTALLFLTFYSAIFLSILTTPEIKLPITSFKDLITDSRYKLGTIKGQPWSFFQQSENKIMKTIFHRLIQTQNPIPKSLDEGHARMCKDDKYAFLTYDTVVNSYSSPNCTLVLIEILGETQLSFALQHNSPHSNIVNSHLLKLRESGVLKKIEHKYLRKSPKIEKSWTPISELEILPILYICFSCMLLSIILLILEILIYRMSDKRRNKSCLSVK